MPGTLSGTLLTAPGPPATIDDPGDVAGLTLWFKADSLSGLLDGDPVVTWPDSSGGGRDVAQGTAGARPIYHTNVVNGHPAVRFDGTDDCLSRASVLGSDLFAPGASTVFVVQKYVAGDTGTLSWENTGDGSNRVVVSATYSGIVMYDHGDVAGGGARVDGAAPAGFAGAWHLLEFGRTPAPGEGEVVIDGTSLATDPFTNDLVTTPTATLTVGAITMTPAGTFGYLDGDVAEIAVYNRVLTPTERTGVRNGLAAKYGITLGGGPGPTPTFSEQEEFNGSFASWRNIVTADGADPTAGADSTSAFQTAFASGARTIYLPAGTYRVTSTVYITTRRGLRVIGHAPEDTRILWDGPVGVDDNHAGGASDEIPQPPTGPGPVNYGMFQTGGVSFSAFRRITFDGQSRAGSVGIDLAQPPGGGIAGETTIEILDCEFLNCSWGLKIGSNGDMGSEVHVRRCRFLNNWSGAVSAWNYNALDIWVDDCLFENCYVNATNEGHGKGHHNPPAGNYHMRRCRSRGAKWAFASFCNTSQNFHFLDCISYQDNTFLGACDIGVNGAAVVIQRCKILDSVLNLTPERAGNFCVKPWRATIEIGNPGPLTLLDTDIRTRADWASLGPPALIHLSPPFQYFPGGPPEGDAFFLDCRVSDEIGGLGAISINGRVTHYNTQLVPRAQIATPEAATAGVVHCPITVRTVIEPGSPTSAGIQAAIDSCAPLIGQRPVVHLPEGDYNLMAGLVVPAGSDLQLVGDGYDGDASVQGTRLRWAGASGGQVLTVNGPSTVCLRDLYLYGDIFSAHGTGNGLLIQGVDQEGSRVQGTNLKGTNPGDNEAALDLSGIDHCLLRIDAGGHGPAQNGRGTMGTRHTGGAVLNGGGTASGGVVFVGVACDGQGEVYRVRNGGRIVCTAGWWENGQWYTFLDHNQTGHLDFCCYNVQPAHSMGSQWEDSGGTAGGRDQPDMYQIDARGDITLVGVTHSGPYLARRRIEGDGTNARWLMLNTIQQGERDDRPWASQSIQIENSSPLTKLLLLHGKASSHDGWLYPLAEIRTNVPPATEEATVREMLARLRSRLPSLPPAGVRLAPDWARPAAVPAGCSDIWISSVWCSSAWVPFRITP